MDTNTPRKGRAKRVLGVGALLLGTAIIFSGGGYYVATGKLPTLDALQTAMNTAPTSTAPAVIAPEDLPGEERVVAPIAEIAPAAETLSETTPAEEVEATDITTETSVDVEVVEASPEAVPAAPPADPLAEAMRLSPQLAETISQGRILPQGVSAVEWGQSNMGYVGRAQKGDVIPGFEHVRSAPDEWILGDDESEGGGNVETRYFSVSGPITFGENGEIVVDETYITLSGVVFPGPEAICASADGEEYDCMSWAQSGLETYIEGKMAVCSVSEMMAENYALCDVMVREDGRAVDLASWAVSAGLALAHDLPSRSLYHPQETEAKARGAGLWEGSFAFAGRQEGEIPTVE